MYSKAIQAIKRYLGANWYESKANRLIEVKKTSMSLSATLTAIFELIQRQEITLQSAIGQLEYLIPLKDKLDRIKTIAEIIAIAAQVDLLDITWRGRSYWVDVHTRSKELEFIQKIEKFPIDRQPVKYKNNKGCLLGSLFNRHKGNICLSHLNRMNSIPLKLDWEVIVNCKEEPKEIPTNKQQKKQWDQLVKDSKEYYENIDLDTFYLKHAYDSRGRCYCTGYYVDYQGADFKKAIVKLANKEICND